MKTEYTNIIDGIAGRRIGVDYEFLIKMPPVRVWLTALREESGGLRAEVRIESRQQGNAGEILRDRLDLVSGQRKAALARQIRERTKVEAPWDLYIEAIANATVDDFRRGEPVITLNEVPEQPLRYLVTPILVEGEFNLIYGDGGSGKSLLALMLAVLALGGIKLARLQATRAAKACLYLDWETNPQTQARRLRSLLAGIGADGEIARRVYYRYMMRGLSDDIDNLRRLRDQVGAEIIIVDSMAPAVAGEPESAEVVLRFANALRSIEGATKLVITHVTKQQAEQKGAARPFGSAFTLNMSRLAWSVRSTQEYNRLSIMLQNTKANDGKLHPPLGVQFDFQEGGVIAPAHLEPLENPLLQEHAALPERIRNVLRKNGAMDPDMIAEELGDTTRESVRQTLRHMSDVVRLEEGGGRRARTVWGLRAPESN